MQYNNKKMDYPIGKNMFCKLYKKECIDGLCSAHQGGWNTCGYGRLDSLSFDTESLCEFIRKSDAIEVRKGFYLAYLKPWTQEWEKEVTEPQQRKAIISRLVSPEIYEGLTLEGLREVYILVRELKKKGEGNE